MSRNPIEMIRQLATRKGRVHFGRYTIEGTRILERALRANAPIETILVSHTASTESRIAALLATAKLHTIPVHLTADETMRELCGGRKLGAIVGVVKMDKPPLLADMIAHSERPLLLAIVDVVEPGNVGAMIRTAHGLGACGILTVGKSDVYNPKAVRTAMGSLFKLPTLHYISAETLLSDLHNQHITTIASVAKGGTALPAVQFSSHGNAILLGGEFYGLTDTTIAACDQRVTIPMVAGIDSFSVSAAAAILLYAAQN